MLLVQLELLAQLLLVQSMLVQLMLVQLMLAQLEGISVNRLSACCH